jgi:hypothetical protein
MIEQLPGLHHVFKIRPREDLFKSPTTVYHSDRALDAFTNGAIIAIGLFMLFGPLWWLAFIDSSIARLGITTGFVFFFTILLASATVAKPFEVLAATAA